jgi:hypothetical protein
MPAGQGLPETSKSSERRAAELQRAHLCRSLRLVLNAEMAEPCRQLTWRTGDVFAAVGGTVARLAAASEDSVDRVGIWLGLP